MTIERAAQICFLAGLAQACEQPAEPTTRAAATAPAGDAALGAGSTPYHEAGVSDGLAEPGLSFEENARRIASVPLLFEPGTHWHHGLSVDLLGGVVARAGGATLPHAMPFFEGKIACRSAIAIARAARSRSRAVPAIPAPAEGYEVGSRMRLRFAEAIRTGGAPILKPETARAMTRSQTGDLRVIEGPGWGFGLGVGVMVDPVASGKPLGAGTWSWGGVYGTYFWVDPEARLTVIVMTNSAGEGLMSFPSAVEKAVYGP